MSSAILFVINVRILLKGVTRYIRETDVTKVRYYIRHMDQRNIHVIYKILAFKYSEEGGEPIVAFLYAVRNLISQCLFSCSSLVILYRLQLS